MSPHKQSSQENFHTNGKVNGQIDGQVDGQVDGMADGMSDGMSDGMVDGEADGMADGVDGSTKHSTRPTYNNVLDKFNIAGKVYIVTGGGRGLGLALCGALLEADAYATQKQYLSADNRPSPLQYRRIDVRETEEIDSMVASIASSHSRIDGLIAAAAIQQATPAIEYTAKDISKMMSINYSGVFLTATAVAREMQKWKTPGSILFVASMSGMVANKGLTTSVYNSSKAALIQLSRNMAMEWGGRGIRVNSLCPGHIKTPMVQEHLDEEPELEEFWSNENMLGRLSSVDGFKGAAIFLLSEASSFMTGSSIVIDGGHTAW